LKEPSPCTSIESESASANTSVELTSLNNLRNESLNNLRNESPDNLRNESPNNLRNESTSLNILKENLRITLIETSSPHILKSLQNVRKLPNNEYVRLFKKLNGMFPTWYFVAMIYGKIRNLIPLEPITLKSDLYYRIKYDLYTDDDNLVHRKLSRYDNNIETNLLIALNSDLRKDSSSVLYGEIITTSHKKIYVGTFKVNQIETPFRASIPLFQYSRLQKLYDQNNKFEKIDKIDKIDKGFPLSQKPLYLLSKFEEDLLETFSMYYFLDIKNNGLSIPLGLFDQAFIELFGSPFNTQSMAYCSPFPIEKKFGSLGSFFDYTLEENKLYLANPPFVDVLINEMAQRICSQLDLLHSQGKDTTVLIILPKWEEHILIGYSDENINGLNLLLSYAHEHILINENHKFYNYSMGSYIPIMPCHFILLGVPIVSLDLLSEKWLSLCV
jgi:hypothetical protein